MQINLLPREKVKKRSPYLEQGITAAISVVVTLVVLFSFWLYLLNKIDTLDKKILDTKVELEKLKKDEAKIAELKKSTQIYQQKVNVIKQLEKNKTGPVKILDEIAIRNPKRMWLNNLKYQGTKLTLEGIAVDNETIAQFMTNLEDSPEFMNVELQVAEETKVDEFMFKRFVLTATIESIKEPEAATEVSDKGKTKK